MDYTLKVSVDDLGVIAEALSNLPLGKSMVAFIKIQNQVQEQDRLRSAEAHGLKS